MEKTNCFFCGSECEALPKLGASDGYNCMYCGLYRIGYASKLEDFTDVKHIVAGYLEETNSNRTEPLLISRDNIDMIVNDALVPKTTLQKLEKLLLYCYKRNQHIGHRFGLVEFYKITKDENGLSKDKSRRGIAYIKKPIEIIGMLYALIELKWVSATGYLPNGGISNFSITAKGLVQAEQLLTTNIDSNKVFIAMAFNAGYKEKCEQAIKPACKRCGFEAQKVDDENYNGNIVDRIIVKIRISKFVIADYTFDNSGAYYEAGYADGMGIPVIECCEKAWFDDSSNKVHLDKRNNVLILYDDYKHLEQLLVDKIRATIPNAKLED